MLQEHTVIDVQDAVSVLQLYQQVKNSRYWFHDIYDSLTTAILVIDAQAHIIVDANPTAVEMIGLNKNDIIGKLCYEFVCPKEKGKCPVTDLGEIVNKKETVLLRKNNDSLPILKNVSIVNENGRKYLVESFVEITRLKQAEKALMESEKRFRDLALACSDWIWEVDENRRYTYVSETTKDVLGFLPDEVIGKTPFDFMSPEEAKRIAPIFEDILKNRRPIENLENWNITKDGQKVCLLTNGVPIFNEDGVYKGYRGIDKNITERKLAEDKMHQLVDELKNINSELDNFAYIVTHDLKAPLRGIKSLAEWISEDCKDKLNNDSRDNLALLSKRVERMYYLIEGVLQYSRIGRKREEHVEIDMNQAVLDAIDFLAPPDNISVTIQKNLPTIVCEKTRVSQILQNLIGNAIKYMDKPKGRITINCFDKGKFWKFSVSDNGPGIEEKHFDRIFKIFQTLHSKDSTESTGIGLTLVKKIVELYGGKVWLESTVGKGTTFFFTIPKKLN